MEDFIDKGGTSCQIVYQAGLYFDRNSTEKIFSAPTGKYED